MATTIHVTDEDIRFGIRKSCCACPIALALQRQGFPGADVYDERFACPSAHWFPLPLEACQFIKDFDNDRPVKPFSFDVEPR